MHIIDTHVHLWDLDRFRLPWLDNEGAVLNRTWSYEAYLRQQADAGYVLDGAVYIEVDMAHELRSQENQFLVDLVDDQSNIFAGGCISGDLTTPTFSEYIQCWSSVPEIKGVRQVLHIPSAMPGTCLTQTFMSNVRLLGDLGLVFEGCVRNEELGDLYQLAKECPQTTIVVDHMGIVDADIAGTSHPTAHEAEYLQSWKLHMNQLGSLPNTVCKISGLNPVQTWNDDTVKHATDVAFEAFSPEKVMFASNFPVLNVSMNLDEWIQSMLRITEGMSEKNRERLFAENARKIYKL
jgi:predicted TIM-barrel fold metal-dependent hydrolase